MSTPTYPPNTLGVNCQYCGEPVFCAANHSSNLGGLLYALMKHDMICRGGLRTRLSVYEAHEAAILEDKDREIARLRALLSDVEYRNNEIEEANKNYQEMVGAYKACDERNAQAWRVLQVLDLIDDYGVKSRWLQAHPLTVDEDAVAKMRRLCLVVMNSDTNLVSYFRALDDVKALNLLGR